MTQITLRVTLRNLNKTKPGTRPPTKKGSTGAGAGLHEKYVVCSILDTPTYKATR